MKAPTKQIEDARLALAKCGEKGALLAGSINDRQWSSPSADGKWSASECFAHLNLTASAMLPLFKAGAEQARVNRWLGERSLEVGLLPRVLIWFLEPPYRIRTRTQTAFLPRQAEAKSEVLKAWNEHHSAFDLFIRENSDLALDRPQINSPFDLKGRVRYSVYAGLLILGAHERRHLWQAALAAQ